MNFNNYLRCIRAMQTASKNLMETLSDIYEKEWVGQDMLYVQAQNNEMLWADLAHKLSDQVVIPLNTYQAQFPEMRKKIDKRGRKLIDSSRPTSRDPSNQHLVSLSPTTLRVAPNPSPSWKPLDSRNSDVMEVVNKF